MAQLRISSPVITSSVKNGRSECQPCLPPAVKMAWPKSKLLSAAKLLVLYIGAAALRQLKGGQSALISRSCGSGDILSYPGSRMVIDVSKRKFRPCNPNKSYKVFRNSSVILTLLPRLTRIFSMNSQEPNQTAA
jgi:hypothetical protein